MPENRLPGGRDARCADDEVQIGRTGHENHRERFTHRRVCVEVSAYLPKSLGAAGQDRLGLL